MATNGENRENATTANSGGRREPELPEFLQLHGGDNPGMILVSTPFDGTDFLAWRRSVVIALRAKMKLGFIDGRYITPEKNLETYDTWVCTCGLCICGATRATAEEYNETKLIQFLTGLDDSYDSIRNQILVKDPFPSLNKAYSMVLRVERQRLVNMQTGILMKTVNKGNYRGKGVYDKRSQTCSHCGRTGHMKETCFKLHGVPEWYKDLKDQKRREVGPTRGFTVVTGEDLKTKDVLAVGRVIGGLYILDKHSFDSVNIHTVPIPSSISKCNMSHAENDTLLWHKRLGHPSFPVLQHIQSIKSPRLWDAFDICHISKQQRLPFPRHHIQSSHIFELIHVDVWGPYRTSSITNCHYFLTIVDDFSRAVWTFLLQNKTQVSSKLSSFFTSIQTQFHTHVKTIRSDNGSEFVNEQCHALFQSLGIHHQRSCPHTPQQNGIVERKHKHLLNIARSLLHQASLPRKFWGDCILTAAYLINRLPSSLLN
ncbi:UNVERIFIED_CONTAM: Retrovirus-related Pol polyprotein from transposon RE2 [Sesamum latifolium]|uniref:Retrovirus-related Pol polyprotein from transposon RE2 n=1 Tax=Sesamum latifolium TaxID=2727402 RepID=A0AAW2U581_9LAMI